MDGPSNATVDDLATNLGIELDERELADVTAIVGATLADVRGLEELPEPSRPSRGGDPTERSGHRPSDGEDPNGAWLRKCRVVGAEDGPLSGTTVGLKDTISLAGVEMTIGSPEMDGYVPSEDATIVTRLLDAGAHIVGKNTMIGIGAYEPPTNPTAPEYSIGGSTSGGAAAVAAGEVDVAIGGDQAGSIRIPASYAGLVGLKPTYGLIPYTGIFGHGSAIDHTGPITRTVTDVAIATEVMAGRDGLDTRQPSVLPNARYSEALVDDLSETTIGVLREGFERPRADADVTATVSEAIDDLAASGATVREVSVPIVEDGLTIAFPINLLGLGKTLKQGGAPVGSDGWFDIERIEFTDGVAGDGWEGVSRSFQVRAIVAEYLERSTRNAVYANAKNLALAARRDLDEALRDVDALALPTAPNKPRASDAERGTEWLREHGIVVPSAVNTALFNATHHPALTVPCGRADGAPVGMMLVGDHFDEASLFRIAYAYEQHTDHGLPG